MLEIKKLKKAYRKNEVLKGVDCTIQNGEIVTLLGNNGAGKTTIINCILKMIKSDSGLILFNGTNIRQISNREYFSKISALLETSINVYDYLTGWQNIEYFASLSGISVKGNKKLEEYIDRFSLRDSLYQSTGEYSRGMQQKLALIISLLNKPDILLLDEPTLGLDIKSKLSVIELLKQIAEIDHVGILLTTHQMDVVEKLNSRMLLLKNGTVENFYVSSLNTKNHYQVSFIKDNAVHTEEETGDFKQVVEKYQGYEVIEIKKKTMDLEQLIMEKLDESAAC